MHYFQLRFLSGLFSINFFIIIFVQQMALFFFTSNRAATFHTFSSQSRPPTQAYRKAVGRSEEKIVSGKLERMCKDVWSSSNTVCL